MDKNRIDGTATELKGKIQKMAGQVTGDAKLETKGRANEAAGAIQNKLGQAKDALRDASKR